MLIDAGKCIGCEECVPYCPMEAIEVMDGVGRIDQELCVECGVCYRVAECPSEALTVPELDWPRSVRAFFSDPVSVHPLTGLSGRGTEEMKTNDITHRFMDGEAGMGVEVGRPGVGTTFQDVELISMEIAKLKVAFEEKNPLTALMSDKKTGKIREDVLKERVLSAIIEFKVELAVLPQVIKVLRSVEDKVNTVFTLDLICKVAQDGSIPTIPIAHKLGIKLSENTKTNIGWGHL